MEESSSEKLGCDGSAKAVQQCLTDIFTSVYTTCDIPENAIFGPCVLSHTSLFDSIAFIALKSTDKRTAPYIFRVDTSTASASSDSLMWLRLVQSARNSEEQNLEAYVKNGQLFYRSLRRIEKDEELLVWYGKDLVELLLLSSGKAEVKHKVLGAPPYLCPDCNQRFQFEFPFVAHLRFRCSRKPQINGVDEVSKDNGGRTSPTSTPPSPKISRRGLEGHSNSQDVKPATDFHNLARDLENNRTCPPSDKEAEVRSKSVNKRKTSDMEESRAAGLSRSHMSKNDAEIMAPRYMPAYTLGENRQAFSSPSPEPAEGKRSAFTEVKKSQMQGQKQSAKNLSFNTENKDGSRPSGSPPEKHAHIRPVLTETQPHSRMDDSSAGSAFMSVTQQITSSERKSAFSQPVRSFSQLSSPLMMTPKLLPTVDCHPSVGDTMSPTRMYQSDPLAAKLQSSELLQSSLPKHSPFIYATAFWPKTSGPIQMQMPSALTLLPPTFTSLCLPAQNWCAKCNASFRMTSDLVYHMRSHHKKEFSMEPLVKRRREEKLKCPICNESFRERHHLSRHMTSHN
ncbi:PR domain zinc finger protein 8-like [Paramormyrops kingsleyae]|nr:PR domain zinc finger protein 8-like [Paramormyrops kingsleyae]